jgi:carboxymethylenebutenolidase
MPGVDDPLGKPEFSVTPKGATACIVVFHEVWGLVGHTQDVCKRIGKLGFAAKAPNLYRDYGDVLTPARIQQAMEAVWNLSLEERRNKTKVDMELDRKKVGAEVREVVSVIYDPNFRDRLLEDAVSIVDKAHSDFDDVATLGFCLGGGLSMKAATKSRRLTCAVSFYGEPPATPSVREIRAPVLAIHAETDEIINQKVPEFVGAMLDEGKDLTLKTYPKTKHGFFNDRRRQVYNKGAAEEAWDITKWFLERKLA